MQRKEFRTLMGYRALLAAWMVMGATTIVAAQAKPAKAAPAAAASKGATLDRIQRSGTIKFGYRVDARPFSFKDEAGKPAGYSVALCQSVAEAVKAAIAPAPVNVVWVAVAAPDRFNAVQGGQVDLFCGADTETLLRREQVDFSLPIFPSGIGALLRADAPERLKDLLSGKRDNSPQWRASAGQLLQAQVFTVVTGTTAEPWLASKLNGFNLTAKVVKVSGYEVGIQGVADRMANVFFGDRAILLDAAARYSPAGDLVVLDRYFTYEPLALSLARNDAGFRLVVDRAISRFYKTPQFSSAYAIWFGEPGLPTQTFFAWNSLPE